MKILLTLLIIVSSSFCSDLKPITNKYTDSLGLTPFTYKPVIRECTQGAALNGAGKYSNYIQIRHSWVGSAAGYVLYSSFKKDTDYTVVKNLQHNAMGFYGVYFNNSGIRFFKIKAINNDGNYTHFSNHCLVVYQGL